MTKAMIKRCTGTLVALCIYSISGLNAQNITVKNDCFRTDFSEDGVSVFQVDRDSVNLIADNQMWGDILIRYRVNQEDWNMLETGLTRRTCINKNTYVYTDSLCYMPLCMKRYYTLAEDGLHLKIEISNITNRSVELGDIAFPFKWREGFNVAPSTIFESNFTHKHNIALNSSFQILSKPSGVGPFYIMMTGEGTPLEYFDTTNNVYTAYLHSGCTGPKTEGSWRIPHTTRVLAPGEKVNYSFLLTSVSRYEDIRNAIYTNGLLDVRTAPGYTIPSDLSVRVAIRLKGTIQSLVAEHPQQTEIKQLGRSPDGRYLYDIRFHKLGENIIWVNYNHGEKSFLEFFSTEPLDVLIKKRSSFIVNKQQHKAPGKWWDGLYSVYDMKYGKLRGPEDTDGFNGWWEYVWGCDDPILSKAPFVAAKNVVYPDSTEIASLEYYLKNFVWGKLQRTDQETPYPFAIYGVPNWHVARDSALQKLYKYDAKDRIKVWRAYDYPHIFKLYYHMSQIAEMIPEWTHYLTADEYFDRAVQTAMAYFKYPYEIWSWLDIYKWGMYNEWVVLELIKGLEQRGRNDEAAYLRGEWEKKAKYFIYDDKYPYRSEHSFDRTAFESSYALAKYAIEHPMKPDKDLWYDKNKRTWHSHPKVTVEDAERFMKQQHYAGLSVRGWIAPKYYLSGTDCAFKQHTGDMSYMAMMGGWSVLDYGLLYSKNPDWIELGYNSFLSSWSLMNTGNETSNYGYWYPGKEKDGATGWCFVGAKNGYTWLHRNEKRGPWRYDGEIDLGYGAAFHTARTIVIQDSIFGLHAYGGVLSKEETSLSVIPRDGVRQQFSFITSEFRYHLTLSRDGFLPEAPIKIERKGKQSHFMLENKINTAMGTKPSKSGHPTLLQIRADKIVPYKVQVGKKVCTMQKCTVGWEVRLPVSEITEEVTIWWK